jgi:hypothetical protein
MFESLRVEENYRVKIFHIGGFLSEEYNIRKTFSGLQQHVRNLQKDKNNYEIEVYKNNKLVVNFINY